MEEVKTKLGEAEEKLEIHYKEKGNIFKSLDESKMEAKKSNE